MDTRKLLSLIKRGEGPKLDYKVKLELWTESGKKELAKDISAIANSKGGRGYLIVGIEDKSKEAIGVKEEETFKEEQVQQIITSRCEPPIPIEVEFLKFHEKNIGVITIYDGNQKPYQIKENGAFYIRRGSTTDIIRKQELLTLFEENLDLSIETFPAMKSSIEFLNMELIDKYFRNKGIYINDDNKSFLLESSGIIYREKESGKEKCTYGGLLVFSDNNSLVIPYNMIRIINDVNKGYKEVTIIQGNLLDMILNSERVVNEILETEYPVEAILEAIKNAVLYREYSEVNRIIEVVISRKSIIIESPGGRIEKNIKGNNENYMKRNMWIYEKLITLDDRNIFLKNGKGFSRMQNAFKGRGKIKLINSRVENSFKVILPGI
ncbi:helix-turn-helix domain-containing protein [Clostridium vincentii]|uniref:Divergent AAA domain protein n=1 Tax=Clostridium vincentii TaxID=52704 RepID=A0A2T0BGT2_9CLOT|nr:RNA-binding domain-containing protein [Clostridium vincentii]PRR83032.1 Divergent AAA domain protein [Clostridium vincentii]